MNPQTQLCPLCEEGQLHERMDFSEVEYKGQHASLPLYFAECDACGSEQGSAEHIRRNKRAMIAFKKQVDGLLPGAGVRAIRERLGITQAQASQIFGGGPVAFSKYEGDDVMQSEAMDKLLRLASEVPEAFAKLARDAHVEIRPAAARPGDWQAVDWQPDQSSLATPRKTPRLRVVHSSKPEPAAHYENAA